MGAYFGKFPVARKLQNLPVDIWKAEMDNIAGPYILLRIYISVYPNINIIWELALTTTAPANISWCSFLQALWNFQASVRETGISQQENFAAGQGKLLVTCSRTCPILLCHVAFILL